MHEHSHRLSAPATKILHIEVVLKLVRIRHLNTQMAQNGLLLPRQWKHLNYSENTKVSKSCKQI